MAVVAVPGGVLVEVRVRPRSRPRWEIDPSGLLIGVAAPPVCGSATEEARRAVAKALGVAPSRVSLHRGARSRTKVFAVSGVDLDAARAALQAGATWIGVALVEEGLGLRAAGIGAPAHVHNRKLDRSWRSGSYSDSSPCRNVGAVTAAVQPKR